VFGRDSSEHDARLRTVLRRICAAGLTLNRAKCAFGQREITFLGHIKKLSAIREMPPPTNIMELWRFMGVINQLGKFSPNTAELSAPFCTLLSVNQAWFWGPDQDKAFNELKMELTTPHVLIVYNPQAQTKISADASSFGLGAVLLQSKGTSWHPVAYASRSMTNTECRYAQIEKEALAIIWACEKFSSYIIGNHNLLETDHKPLVPLLTYKHLENLPPRVLRFRLRLMRFDYNIVHVAGKYLYTADLLSRVPRCASADAQSVSQQEDIEYYIRSVTSYLPASNKHHRSTTRGKQRIQLSSMLYPIASQDGQGILFSRRTSNPFGCFVVS